MRRQVRFHKENIFNILRIGLLSLVRIPGLLKMDYDLKEDSKLIDILGVGRKILQNQTLLSYVYFSLSFLK